LCVAQLGIAIIADALATYAVDRHQAILDDIT